jgi:predicted trehalose synthase
MIRSFHYISSAALFGQIPGVISRPESAGILAGWARFWYLMVSAAFLKEYLATAAGAPFLPRSTEEIYEVSYELNNRPDWVRIPLQGILDLMEAGGA